MAWKQLSLLPELGTPDRSPEEPMTADVALQALRAYFQDRGEPVPSPLASGACPDCGEPLSKCGDCGAPVCLECRTGELLPGCALPRCDDCLGWYDEGLSPEALDVLLGGTSFEAWADLNR